MDQIQKKVNMNEPFPLEYEKDPTGKKEDHTKCNAPAATPNAGDYTMCTSKSFFSKPQCVKKCSTLSSKAYYKEGADCSQCGTYYFHQIMILAHACVFPAKTVSVSV